MLIGLNHKTATVEERERALTVFRSLPGVLLATCNRVELYQIKNEKLRIKNEGIYYYENEEVVRHLFRVASGLDSQILGEWEILGQVREVYSANRGKNWMLDQLFEHAVEVGRRVREETSISQGNVSIASVAVAKAREYLREIANQKIILIGWARFQKRY
ncbi:MAG: hypothetical protein ACPL4K_02120 [Candidatus Margulisiibacteriota bacterium]